MNQIRGSQSISFGEAPYLISSACVAGKQRGGRSPWKAI